MFVDAPEAAEDPAAAGADPFEEAHTLSDEESEQTGNKTEQRRGNNKPHAKHTAGPRDSRQPGKGAAATLQKKGAERESGGMKPLHSTHNSRGNGNSSWNKSHSSGPKQFPPDKSCKQHNAPRDTGRSNGTQHPTQKQPQHKTPRDSSAAAKDTKNQPTRIGLSKHKAANQHLIFNSDEE